MLRRTKMYQTYTVECVFPVCLKYVLGVDATDESRCCEIQYKWDEKEKKKKKKKRESERKENDKLSGTKRSTSRANNNKVDETKSITNQANNKSNYTKSQRNSCALEPMSLQVQLFQTFPPYQKWQIKMYSDLFFFFFFLKDSWPTQHKENVIW